MKQPALSMFAGAGGLDAGVDQQGFKTICAIELDPHCASTLAQNAPRKIVWRVDVRAMDPVRMMATLNMKPGDLRLLHGGPPCQPYSQMGLRGGLQDPRGALVFEMARFAEAFRPAAVVIEQVPKFLGAAATEADGLAASGQHACWAHLLETPSFPKLEVIQKQLKPEAVVAEVIVP